MYICTCVNYLVPPSAWHTAGLILLFVSDVTTYGSLDLPDTLRPAWYPAQLQGSVTGMLQKVHIFERFTDEHMYIQNNL